MLTKRLAAQQPLESKTIDGAQASTYEANQQVVRTRIYDQVTGSYMDVEPLNLKHYMAKWVSVCSVCSTRHSTLPGLESSKRKIQAHIQAVRQSAVDHQNAEAVSMIAPEGTGNRCTGCGASFLSRPNEVYTHIERAKKMGPLHKDAEALTLKLFDLMPPVLEKPEATPVAVTEPGQVAPGGRRKPSRRRRRHGRRKESVA